MALCGFKEFQLPLVHKNIIKTVQKLQEHSADSAGPEAITLRKGFCTNHQHQLIYVNIALGRERNNPLKVVRMLGKHVKLNAVIGVLRVNFHRILQIVKAKACLDIPGIKVKGLGTEIFALNEFKGIIWGQAQCAGRIQSANVAVYFDGGRATGKQNDRATFLPPRGDLRSHRRDPNWGLGTSSGSPEGLGLNPSEVGSQGKQWGRGCMETARKVEGLAQTPECPVRVHTYT